MLNSISTVNEERLVLIPKKGSTLHDFPYSGPARKCPHFWIVNVTPPGPAHCIHRCVYCYARQAVYSDYSLSMRVYNNLPELVAKDLQRIHLCPPISISNVSDPCQEVPELRREVSRLVRLLVDHGVSFSITTKGDARFLLAIPGFITHPRKFIGITIEGTGDILELLSPGAPPFAERLSLVRDLAGSGIDTLVRLDPLFIHLFQALYGERWFDEIAGLLQDFAGAGARHVVCSTGRLTRQASPVQPSTWDSVLKTISRQSRLAAAQFGAEYVYERGDTSQGYFLRRDLRSRLHQQIRAAAESCGMSYGVCQELGTDADSPGLAHCERFALPFTRRQPDGRFRPVAGCTANCHITCTGGLPPCGKPELASPAPFRAGLLRQPGTKLPLEL